MLYLRALMYPDYQNIEGKGDHLLSLSARRRDVRFVRNRDVLSTECKQAQGAPKLMNT
jgi:hypothetical protein